MKKRDMGFIRQFFALAHGDILCNTSYPIRPAYFAPYRTNGGIMEGVQELSFYFHIPFCKTLCRFCEYTRFLSESQEQEERYIQRLARQVERYLDTHPVSLVYGMDIGGGTPTALSDENFERLLSLTDRVHTGFRRVSDFQSSIEFSYSTINERKIACIASHGFQRVSAGLQTTDKHFLELHEREATELEKMQRVNQLLKEHGVHKLNLDIMYGFDSQTKDMLRDTLRAIRVLMPEQVTLYETRYNMNSLTHHSVSRELLYEQYGFLFDTLTDMGYHARFGQNAFSRCDDEGVSSYLKYRMNEGIPYQGFGISAQSMSRTGLSYNNLKSASGPHLPDFDEIAAQDVYLLPPEELAAKYISIALYSGRFSLSAASRFLGTDAAEHFRQELQFLQQRQYVTLEDGNCTVTREGYMYYGAIAALFWSAFHREQYLQAKGMSLSTPADG